MPNIIYENLKNGDVVIFARILPQNKLFELLDLQIVSVHEKYCTGTDLKTKQTYPIERKHAENVLFLNRNVALKYLNDKKAERRKGGENLQW